MILPSPIPTRASIVSRSTFLGGIFLICVSQSFAQQRLVMVGGGLRPQEATSRFVEWAGNEKARILIICWATEAPHEAFNSLNKTFSPFRPETIEPAPPAPLTAVTKLKFLGQLHTATGVFFSGGDQVRIMDVLRDQSLLQALRLRYAGGVVFGGTSAGTAIMSHRMITGEGDFRAIDGSKVETRSGVGLLPTRIIVDQHFIKRQRQNRLFALILQGPEDFGIGIDEGTALLVKDNRIGEVVGASQVMVVASQARRDSLIIQLARPGDRIDLFKRKVIKKRRVENSRADRDNELPADCKPTTWNVCATDRSLRFLLNREFR